jgi:hypothetical protein
MHECGSTECVSTGTQETSTHECRITPVTIATTEYIVVGIAFRNILSPSRLTLFGLV